MSFLHPGVLWALASILVLIFFSLWRQRPVSVKVASLRIWRQVPDRVAPLKSLKKPRWSLILLLQALVVAFVVLALARPGVVRRESLPRRITVVLDVSPPMSIRGAAVTAELAKLDPKDHVRYIESPTLRRSRSFTFADRMGDPTAALELAASESRHVIWVGDRDTPWMPPPGVTLHRVLVGSPVENVGILDARIDGGKLFVRLTHPVPYSVTIDGVRRTATGFLTLIPSTAARVEVELPADAFTLDDKVVLTRHAESIDVAFEGRSDENVKAAITANPRARIVKSRTPQLLIRIDRDFSPSDAACVVYLEPRGVEAWRKPRTVSVEDGDLGKIIPASEVKLREVGDLGGAWDRVLLSADGKPIVAVKGRDVVIAARWDSAGWPVHPSFPIFWTYLLEYASRGSGEWVAAGLRDASASALGRESRPLDPRALGDRPRLDHRIDLTAAAVLLAAMFLAGAWVMDSKRNA